MMKRIIALLLALILTVGLLPTVALAAEGDGETSSTNAEVVIGKYNDKDQWEPGTPTSTLPDGVKTVSKTAKPTTNANEYEVTLQVVLQQTEENSGKAATVLVLDTSGSMAYCAECGAKDDCVHNYVKFNGAPNSKGQYYYKTTDKNGKEEFERAYYCDRKHKLPNKKHTAGWFTTSGDSIWHDPQTDSLAGQTIYVKSPTPRASRLDAAKVAAENFLKTYSGLTFKTDGTPADNQNNRNLGRYVSVVSFATGAALKQGWVDVSNADNYQTVLNTIKALKADGGTNLDAGLTYAEYLLKQTTVNDAVKNVIALTDGQPTFFIDTNMNAYDDDGLKYLNREFLTIDKTQYRVHGTGDSCNEKTFTETVASADAVKNRAKLYTVCFDAEEKIDVPNNGGQISVSEYLSTKIATQSTKAQFAYDADNAEKLYAEFAKITQSIVSGLNNGTVRDTLPTGITSEAFGEDNVKEWKLNEKPFTKNETTNTVDGKQVTTYTYTYTYTVTINPLTVEKTKIDGAYYAPLNGETTLTVKNGDKNVTIHFPIPAGKVTMPSHTVTWKSQDGNTTLETDNNVEYNTKPSFDRADPTKDADEQYTYTFVGWATEANKETGTLEADLPSVTDDVTYYAAFSKTARTYTVTWMPQDGQGNAYETDTGVAYNASPSYDSEVPTKAADAEHTYTFVGWATSANQETGTLEANLPAVTADVTYYAAFSKTPRTYTVTWMPQDGQGNAYETDTGVAYNARPSYDGTEPTKAADAEHTYTFVGWATTTNQTSGSTVDALPNVTADVTYYAAFSATKQTYTIRFETEAGGTLTGTTECTGLSYGADFPAAPTTTSNVGYYFAGWYDANDNKVTDWPNTVTENATYTAKWLSYNSINLDLTGKIQKTLNSDVALTNEIFTINLTLNGAEVPSATATATATATVSPALDNGSYTDTKPFVDASGDFKLTFTAPGTYIYSIVEEAPVRSGMTYDVNKPTGGHELTVNVTADDTTHALSFESVTVDGTADTDATWLTITNNYVEPKETFNLNTLIKKHFTKADDSAEIPNENFTFTATIESYPNKEDTYIGTVTMNGAENDKYFDFGDSKNLTLTPGTYKYRVTEELGTDTRIRYDSSAYILTISVEDDGSYNVSVVQEAPAAQSLTTAAAVFPDNKQITFTNTYFEKKDPNALYLDFSKFVKKELTATGSKTVDEATFIVDVVGSYDGEAIANALTPTEAQATTDEDVLNTTLTATIKNVVGGNVYEEPFTGSVTVSKPGHYTFTLTERKGTQSGVTYDEAHYRVFVNIMRVGDNLVIHDATTYLNNEQVELIKLENDAPVTAGYIVFKNTIDTGKDDYYPIIIPTIINKDTGMLNKTDHFAYIIGYRDDDLVHPDGQITRAEVATIFFRLLT